MNRLRTKLILIFSTATLAPLAAILWVSMSLLEYSLNYASTEEVDGLSQSLENVSREYYRQVREDLKTDATHGNLRPQQLATAERQNWPASARQFWDSRDAERFVISEPDGSRLLYMIRDQNGIRLFSRTLDGVNLDRIRAQIQQARDRVARMEQTNLHRGLIFALILLSAVIWLISLGGIIFFANRISKPIQELTAGLFQLAEGNFKTQVQSEPRDEVGRAIQAFNRTAVELQQSRERLIYLTQVASWQSLARKMAHELKNSLTPIRLTVEEILARQPAADPKFLAQAAQVVIDEVESLERRVRAFSDFATEPAPNPMALDVNALLQERIQFLSVGHPQTRYVVEADSSSPKAWADADMVKGILTNLLENAAEAAGDGGKVLGTSGTKNGKIEVEVHDSGPGLNVEARASLFEPSISFKRRGMGLGLSIARKNALLSGGELEAIEGRMGGAGFRLTLPARESTEIPSGKATYDGSKKNLDC
jgi:nitrogen fixation/metabolism regulation signal transduction histidine kinase